MEITMALPPPPPPSISPDQMTLLRIVATMAWSDGNLAEEEVDVMLTRFSQLFASGGQQQALREELRDYLMQNIPLEELVPQLNDPAEKELVLKLGYQVISASARTPEEAKINPEEAQAYEKLIGLLNLPADRVAEIEQEAAQANLEGGDLVYHMTEKLRSFMQAQ
jgi:hypothetical protein